MYETIYVCKILHFEADDVLNLEFSSESLELLKRLTIMLLKSPSSEEESCTLTPPLILMTAMYSSMARMYALPTTPLQLPNSFQASLVCELWYHQNMQVRMQGRKTHFSLEEQEVMEAGVDTQLLQTPPELPAPEEEQGNETGVPPEDSVLKCVMEAACDRFHGFQEYEHYSFDVNSGSDCDVPEDELTDEMEDIFSGEDQLVPVNSQEEGPTAGDHGQQCPGNIPVDDTIATEENIEPIVVNLHGTLVNVQVPEPEVPSTLRHLDEMEVIVAIEEDQLVPVNLQEAEHFTEGEYDQSSPVIIPVEDICSEEDLVNVQEEEDPTFQGDHDQLSHPGNIPLEGITSIEENQLVPVNSQEEEGPTEGDRDLPSLVIIPVENLSSEEDHLIPVNLQVEEDPIEGDHDQLSPESISLEDITAIQEDQLDSLILLEQEDFTVQGDHEQPSPVVIPVEDIIAIERNETSPVNLHVTLVNVQVTEPEDPSTPRCLDSNIATFDSVYPAADQEVTPENQLDAKVLTVTTTSAAEGESSSSSGP